MASRLAILAGLVTLNGCCLTVITGLEGESGTAGLSETSSVSSTGGSSSSAGTSTTTGTAGSTGSTSGPSSSAGTTGGATTGSSGSTSSGTTSGGLIPCGVPANDPTAMITTLAGGGAGEQSFADGTGGPDGTARFWYPAGIAVDAAGDIWVADWGNNRIRKLDPKGNTVTIAGDGIPALKDGVGAQAEFGEPSGLTFDGAGNLLVVDYDDNRIRQVDPSGKVTTLPCTGTNGIPFDGPRGIALDHSGQLVIADFGYNRVCAFGPTAGFATAVPAAFDRPWGVAVGPDGSIYVADTGNEVIRKIDTVGNVTRFAGDGATGHVDGPASSAQFFQPVGVAVDPQGNVLVADYYGIRLIVNGIVTTLAKSGSGEVDGTGGINGTGELDSPMGLAVDASCNVYVSDWGGATIRKITFGN